MEPTKIEWKSFRQLNRSYTIDQLSRYSASGVDIHTVQIAEIVCERFKLSSQGQRHLSNAFGNLPRFAHYEPLSTGYPMQHAVREIMGSDAGYVFLSICGVLTEQFREDFVVEVLMELVADASTPYALRPSSFQWKALVQACHGVLSTASFGVLLDERTQLQKDPPPARVDAKSVMRWLQQINISTSQPQKISAGCNAGWVAAVAEWLFGLNVTINSFDGEPLTNSGGNSAQLTVDFKDSSPGAALTPNAITGGRIPWATLFRTCFGATFQNLDKTMLSAAIGSSARIAEQTLTGEQVDSNTYFLPQPSQVKGLSGTGLIETITSWFPELRSLAPRMERSMRLTYEEAWKKYLEQAETLRSTCSCSRCSESASEGLCQVTLVEIIVALGLMIARMAVTPEFYPKRAGLLNFYARHEALGLRRDSQPTSEQPAGKDLKYLASFFPTPAKLLETSCLLFSGYRPPQDVDSECCGLAQGGMCVTLTSWQNVPGPQPQRHGVMVSSGAEAYHGRYFERAQWEKGIHENLTYGEGLDIFREKPLEVYQIAKLRGNDLLVSLIWRGRNEEQIAEAAGWEVCDSRNPKAGPGE